MPAPGDDILVRMSAPAFGGRAALHTQFEKFQATHISVLKRTLNGQPTAMMMTCWFVETSNRSRPAWPMHNTADLVDPYIPGE